MSTKATMQFKRGDGVTHYFTLPIASYAVGASLKFTAKPSVDNDTTDATAVIDKIFNDSNVDITTDPTIAKYTLDFLPSDIVGVTFVDGATYNSYLGEFTYEVSGASPVSFPADNNYINVIIYADIRLAT